MSEQKAPIKKQKVDVPTLDAIMMLAEVLQQLEEVDLMGNGYNTKIKIVNKIDELVDNL